MRPISEFSRLAHGKEGRRSHCKVCDKELNKKAREARRNKNPSHFELHFGFKDSKTKPSEWAESMKYQIDPIKPSRR